MKPCVAILKTDGTNCDNETAYAFKKLGVSVEIVLLNTLRANKHQLDTYSMLVIPGGFSYGDDIASGKIFALELMASLKSNIDEFINRGKLIIGICNGFQVLVRAGILPFQRSAQHTTLLQNDSKKFECRWATMRVQQTHCIFTKGLEGMEVTLPVAHGEGRFFTTPTIMQDLEADKLVALRYTKNGVPTQEYPYNPNGSHHAIAGVCDRTGQVFGLMPHPERFIEKHHHPLWRSQPINPVGLTLLENGINHIKQLA